MGSPAAVSLSRAFTMGQADALRRIIQLAALPREIRNEYRRRIADAYHTAADNDYHNGELADAWRSHYASLRSPGGWRYVPFTRRLIGASLAAARNLLPSRGNQLRRTND